MSTSSRCCFVFLAVACLGGCHDQKAGTRAVPDAAVDTQATTARHDAGAGSGIITGITLGTMATYEGTYTLDDYSVNPSGCDVSGPSETSAHKATFIVAGGPSSRPFWLGLVACADPSECAEKVSAVRSGSPVSGDYVLLLTEEIAPDLLRDQSTYPGYDVDGMCSHREVYLSELTRTGDKIRVETRTIPAADVPSVNKTCDGSTPAQVEQDIQGRACSSLEVISGRKIGPLP
jgi:hypothetical protein